MSAICRTCSTNIQIETSTHLFLGSSRTIKQIELLTGLNLPNIEGFSPYICVHCCWSLSIATAFRDICIATQQKFFKEFVNKNDKCIRRKDVAEIDPLHVDIEDDKVITDVLHLNISPNSQVNGYNINFDEDNIAAECIPADNVEEDIEIENEGEGDFRLLTTFYKGQIKNDLIDEKVDTKMMQTTNSEESTTCKGQINTKNTASLTEPNASNASKWTCEQCGRHLRAKRNLELHSLRHTGKKSYNCGQCDKKCYTPYLAKLHETMHSRPFKCQYCKETFGYSSSLTRHERTHTHARLFSCRRCDKTFMDPSSRRIHEMKHNRDQSFDCKPCNRQFKTERLLRIHCCSKLHKEAMFKLENTKPKITSN